MFGNAWREGRHVYFHVPWKMRDIGYVVPEILKITLLMFRYQCQRIQWMVSQQRFSITWTSRARKWRKRMISIGWVRQKTYISKLISPGQNGPILRDVIFRCFVAPGRFWTNYGMIKEARGIWFMANGEFIHCARLIIRKRADQIVIKFTRIAHPYRT